MDGIVALSAGSRGEIRAHAHKLPHLSTEHALRSINTLETDDVIKFDHGIIISLKLVMKCGWKGCR